MAKTATTKGIELLRNELLEDLTDDYVGVWDVARRVKREWSIEDVSEVRATAMTLLSDPIEDGFITPGLARNDGGFDAWELAPEEAVDRIRREWQELGRMPSLGDIAWFDITPRGERLVRERLAAERPPEV